MMAKRVTQYKARRTDWQQWRNTVLPADRKVMLVALISIALIITAVGLVIAAQGRSITAAAVGRMQHCVATTIEQNPPEAPNFCQSLPCKAYLCP